MAFKRSPVRSRSGPPSKNRGLGEIPAPFRMCAQHGRDLEVKVLWGSWSQRPRANRKAPTARGALKEAGSEAASRRTETGYEAKPPRASGHVTAKLSRPRGGGVDPAVAR